VPFAALSHPRDGAYLIEHAVIVLAPSASLSLSAARDRPREAAATSTLVVGDPELGEKDRGRFGPLPGARDEAREIAALYGAEPLLGADATPAAFLERAQGSHVVHVGSHAEVNENNPLLSSLLLSPDGPDASGRLYAHQILQSRPAGPDVVILAACSTAAGEPPAGEGVAGLVRAFLAAGVPAVLASRWDLDDRGHREIYLELHRQLAAGSDPATALRTAQRTFLAESDERSRSPATWAALSVYGSGIPSSFAADRIDSERTGS
jgi:CHAT domain-containing protein